MKKTPKNYGNGWLQEFPTEEGHYWFHGQRWSNKEDIQTMFCTVTNVGSKPVVKTDDNEYIYSGDVGEKWAFKKINLEAPEPPQF